MITVTPMDNPMFQSTKVFNGYSTAFRQWRAESHCRYLHGYSLSFKVWFEGDLDENNWVANFGGFRDIKTYLSNTFDHTTIVAKDDPILEYFEELSRLDYLQLIVLDAVGCEKFAQHVFTLIDKHISEETKNRVRVSKVECFEDGTKNSAIYKRNK